jgi:hemerythrin superfamily protein
MLQLLLFFAMPMIPDLGRNHLHLEWQGELNVQVHIDLSKLYQFRERKHVQTIKQPTSGRSK